jgi:hypothetical protein
MTMADPDMMSRFSIFKKLQDRQWIRTLKVGVNWLSMAWSWWEIAGKANGSERNNGKNG